MRGCNTFVKSASYLMHYKSFQKIREIVLNKSLTIFQDDTGLPFKHVNNENWTVKCYGSYVKPIADFDKNTDDIQPLIDEITQLREQLLDANQQIFDLQNQL